MNPPVEHVQTKSEIREALASAGLHPRKRFGQHFLIDGNMMRRLVEAAEVDRRDVVLEVGAGTGGLTDLLIRRAGDVIAVEIDRDLYAILCDRFHAAENVALVCGDVLTGKHELRADVARLIREAKVGERGAVKLVANLPYNVATPLIMNLLTDYPQVRRMCFTVQAEVGAKIMAQAGTKAFGPLGIVSQLLCEVEMIAKLGPHYFWPQPAVDSLMLKMEVRENPLGEGSRLKEYVQFVRSVFEHRRKTLRSALGYVVPEDVRDAVCKKFDCSRRPEELSVAEWRLLFDECRRRKQY